MFRTVVLALCLASSAAFVPSTVQSARATTGFWDPLSLADQSFWVLGEEATVGYLRHAEIKHGRVAMAAFVGYCAQSSDLLKGVHTALPYRGYEPGLTPPAQWDAIPTIGKVQILVLIGALESYGEMYTPHYTKGGKPGYYPPIQGKRPEFIFDLYDPFKWFPEKTEAQKIRGLDAEINNGRLAMFGIFSLISEVTVPGSVPPLDALKIPAYEGNPLLFAPIAGLAAW